MNKEEIKELGEEFVRVCGWPLEEARLFYTYWKEKGDELGVLEAMKRLISEHKTGAIGINDRIRADIQERKAA